MVQKVTSKVFKTRFLASNEQKQIEGSLAEKNP
jgi:hypothetical protein